MQYHNFGHCHHYRITHCPKVSAFSVDIAVSSTWRLIVHALCSDASARITKLPDIVSVGLEDESTASVEERVRLARYAVRLVRRASNDPGPGQENLAKAVIGETNPVCQWVNNTDVQNK